MLSIGNQVIDDEQGVEIGPLADRAESFRKCLEEVLNVDAEELFRRHLESAPSAPPGAPGVGLVVLRKDYEAELGVRITPRADGLFEVTVQVRISAEEVDQ